MLDDISRKRLMPLHPALISLMESAAESSPIPFRITSGLRTKEEQMVHYKNGASRLNGIPVDKGGTGISRHQTGNAADIVPMINGKPSWAPKHFRVIAAHIKKIALLRGVRIVWGGDWPKFVDMPHFELNQNVYPPFIKL